MEDIREGISTGAGMLRHQIAQEVNDISDLVIEFDWHWIIGCSIALVAAISSNTGLNLQRLAHLENLYHDPFVMKQPRAEADRVSILRRPRWILGIGLMIFASLADLLALSFAAQSLVASLGALSLVANALIAPIILKESITSREWRAIGMICAGDAIAIAFGQHTSEVYKVGGVLQLFAQTSFIIYAVAMFMIIVSLTGWIWWVEKKFYISHRRYSYAAGGSVASLHKCSHATLSGILGAQSVLLGKAVAELFKTSVVRNSVSPLRKLDTYIVLLLMITFVIMQVHTLNEALKRFEALVVVPVFQTCWTLGSVLGGMVLYSEYKNMTFFQCTFFLSGLVLVLTGVQVMSERGDSDGDGPYDEESNSYFDDAEETAHESEGLLASSSSSSSSSDQFATPERPGRGIQGTEQHRRNIMPPSSGRHGPAGMMDFMMHNNKL